MTTPTTREDRRLGDFLRTCRQTVQMTRADVGARCGVSASTIARIERGERHLYGWEPLYADLIELYADVVVGGLGWSEIGGER